VIAPDAFIHDSALIEAGVQVGSGSRIWHDVHIRKNAMIGERCNFGKGVFVDFDVVIGSDCKIQNYSCVYHGVTLGRGVFVGPHVVFTNDLRPRATGADFAPLGDGDWEVGTSRIGDGAAIGANSTILPNVTIGPWSMVGAGSVVTRDVAPYALVVGNPARQVAWLCRCGRKVDAPSCSRCGPLPADHPLTR
jgi:UDP-2-acetamido-3-amino-2,3-dideoxy-glucuronate N-acetyltransferase